jgi:hypothetical protein
MENAIVYNLTVKIAKSHSHKWLQEMESKILPACTGNSNLVSSQINKILIEDPEDHTFAIQFIFPSQAIFELFGIASFKNMVLMMDENFKGKYVYFATMMEVMHYSSYTD